MRVLFWNMWMTLQTCVHWYPWTCHLYCCKECWNTILSKGLLGWMVGTAGTVKAHAHLLLWTDADTVSVTEWHTFSGHSQTQATQWHCVHTKQNAWPEPAWPIPTIHNSSLLFACHSLCCACQGPTSLEWPNAFCGWNRNIKGPSRQVLKLQPIV